MELSPDWRRFLGLLNAAGVRYLLTGGHAVVYHGHQRTPRDLDVWVPREHEAAVKLVQVLRRLGVDDAGLTPQTLMAHDLLRLGQPPLRLKREGDVATIGVPPFRTEILFWVSGNAFDDCYERCVEAAIDGLAVSVVSLEDLIANKRASNRPGDKDDLERLIEIQEKT